ncbi:MAG: carboxylating nicotinate-nucleotide diphosphorylase [Spirochaetaceae bacterium]|nr:MAG: carboxylating nicotinate-nucleotide diphosphorylase [Spirochaetaceae bacterium]
MEQTDYQPLIHMALHEDLAADGDVTSRALFDDETMEARLFAKDIGILAGARIFSAVFSAVDPETRVELLASDGALLAPDEHVATVRGRAVSVLSAERVALNFLSHLSGIATGARRYTEEAARGGNAVILDTRKTLPGYRKVAKYAVRVGGAQNHRIGLYDMVLLKDNHIDRAGSITTAVERVRAKWGTRFSIEVECRTLDHVREARALEVERILLDNMSLDEMREAVTLCDGAVELEASGNIDLARVCEVSATGVDFISVGGLTHSVAAFDFSLKTWMTV